MARGACVGIRLIESTVTPSGVSDVFAPSRTDCTRSSSESSLTMPGGAVAPISADPISCCGQRESLRVSNTTVPLGGPHNEV